MTDSMDRRADGIKRKMSVATARGTFHTTSIVLRTGIWDRLTASCCIVRGAMNATRSGKEGKHDDGGHAQSQSQYQAAPVRGEHKTNENQDCLASSTAA